MNGVITTKDIADSLGISIARVHQLVRELGLKPESIGKAFIFTPADLTKMVARNTQRGGKRKAA